MPNGRPNLILFTTDQHRGDFLSLAGHPVVETPNLDSFVRRGAYFPHAYTEIPSTTGARRVMLSGLGNFDCGLVGYAGKEWDEAGSLAAVLAQAGYHCINVGWRNLHPRRKLYGFHTVIPHDLGEGDDDYMDWLRQQVGPEAQERGHGLDANGWLARPWHLEERLHPTVWTTNVALDQVRRRDPTRPFFLWVSHLRPHSPYDPPQFFWDLYAGRELPPTPVGDWAGSHDLPQPGLARCAFQGHLTEEQTRLGRVGYMGCITQIDYELGRMLETLPRMCNVALDDTVILFVSDHGDMLGDHHLHRKCYAYEGSARIPFVLQYPQGVDLPSGAFDQPVGLQDVMPTLLELAGVDIPDGLTGRSVLQAVRGEPWREFMHGEHSPCYAIEEAMHYLTDGREKYLWFPYDGREQFFNLTEDPEELRNLASQPEHAGRVALWRQRLVDRLGGRGDGFSDGTKLLPRREVWSPIVARTFPEPNH
ncbi:MAG: arylsulfatase [Armatimonadetes bacterium]|nr:arylsulfatase [Armatimonadota bacterium]